MVIFCRPGWSAGHTNMTIESIVGLGQNSTCRGKTQFTVDISLSTTRVSTVLVCWWQFSLDMSLFALDTATGVARNARVDFLLYIFGKTNWVRKSANLWAWIFGIPSNHINLQIFRHNNSVCLCVCVCIWKQICRMLFANAQALDFINGPHSDFMKEYIAENESLTCGLNEFCFLLSWILPFSKSTKRWIWEYKLCFLHHGWPDGLCKYS